MADLHHRRRAAAPRGGQQRGAGRRDEPSPCSFRSFAASGRALGGFGRRADVLLTASKAAVGRGWSVGAIGAGLGAIAAMDNVYSLRFVTAGCVSHSARHVHDATRLDARCREAMATPLSVSESRVCVCAGSVAALSRIALSAALHLREPDPEPCSAGPLARSLVARWPSLIRVSCAMRSKAQLAPRTM